MPASPPPPDPHLKSWVAVVPTPAGGPSLPPTATTTAPEPRAQGDPTLWVYIPPATQMATPLPWPLKQTLLQKLQPSWLLSAFCLISLVFKRVVSAYGLHIISLRRSHFSLLPSGCCHFARWLSLGAASDSVQWPIPSARSPRTPHISHTLSFLACS